MRGGPLEETEGGSKCILCGTSNPSEKHLDAHKIQKCGNRVQGSFTRKRRGDLVKHLTECHDVREKTQGEAIADKWKETSKEQAWSCGFCGQLFHIFGDRLKHIEAHFERGQTLDEWDTTKVMEGLLLQPRMVDAWKTQLAFSLCLESSDLTWEKHVVKDLQHNLEVGPFSTKHAAALAKSAYELRQPKFLSDDKPPDFALVHGVSGPPTSDYDSIAERALDPYSMRYQPRTVANPSETLHSAMPALYEFPPATYDYTTFPLSEEDNGHAPRPLADQHTAFNGYQEHGNATTGSYNWQASEMLSDEPDDDDMFG